MLLGFLELMTQQGNASGRFLVRCKETTCRDVRQCSLGIFDGAKLSARFLLD